MCDSARQRSVSRDKRSDGEGLSVLERAESIRRSSLSGERRTTLGSKPMRVQMEKAMCAAATRTCGLSDSQSMHMHMHMHMPHATCHMHMTCT
eukprot:2769092-Prymnesium_polylepis.2